MLFRNFDEVERNPEEFRHAGNDFQVSAVIGNLGVLGDVFTLKVGDVQGRVAVVADQVSLQGLSPVNNPLQEAELETPRVELGLFLLKDFLLDEQVLEKLLLSDQQPNIFLLFVWQGDGFGVHVYGARILQDVECIVDSPSPVVLCKVRGQAEFLDYRTCCF